MISRNSNPRLDNIIISNNHSNMGGGLAVYQSEPILENITISENETSNSGGGVYIQNSSPQFNNTLISDNSATNYGGAIWIHENSRPIFNRTTLAYNTAFQGNAIVMSDSANPVIINSIIWGSASNPNDVFSYTESGFDPNFITFLYSDYQLGADGVLGESVTVNWLEGNLSADPLFNFPSTVYDYSLQTASPCIDAGINTFVLDGETIVDLQPDQYNGSNPDMGCFENMGTVGINHKGFVPTDFKLSQNFPNPFNPTTTIHYDLPKQSYVNVTIYDLLGQRVKTLIEQNQDAGYKSVQWDATNISSGMYFYQIRVGEYVQTRRMILLK